MTQPTDAQGPAATAAAAPALPDWTEVLRGLPKWPVFVGLLAGWALLFHAFGNATLGYVATPSLFAWLENAWRHGSEDQLGYFMPLVVLALLWLKRGEWVATPKAMWGWGLALLLLALGLHLVGFVVQQTRLSMVAFLAGIYALVGLVWGWPMMRTIFFPFFLLGFCMPLGVTADNLTSPLRILVAKLAVETVSSPFFLDLDVRRVGSMIFDARMSFQYDVAPACSGIRSLVALTALTTIYGFLTFRSTWRRLFMIAVAVPLAVLGNTLRIILVIIVGQAFGQNAGAAVEQPLGFVTYAVALGAVLLLGRWLREDNRPPARPHPEPAEGRP